MHAVSRKRFIATLGSTTLAAFAAARCAPAARRLASDLASGSRPDAPGSTASSTARADAEPGYLHLYRSGELKRRGDDLWRLQDSCCLCPRKCGAARLRGERGFCGATSSLEVAAFHPHYGEEAPLVGRSGSGTIFLRHCNLRCVFCINRTISQGGPGRPSTISELADAMLALQARGCHNINIVTPTHYSPQVVLALDAAARRGLRVPLVYNTSGWERLEVLQRLSGIVDIYLPDVKYASSEAGNRYSSGAADYADATRLAVIEMHRQVGVARPAADGLMYRGLMIRHLVMPNDVSGTRAVLSWIAANLPKDTYVNLMSQYQPAFKAHEFPAIARPITRREHDDAVSWARGLGLTNLDVQPYRGG
jgi:putative pyruvate formate lyase activating enzyme